MTNFLRYVPVRSTWKMGIFDVVLGLMRLDMGLIFGLMRPYGRPPYPAPARLLQILDGHAMGRATHTFDFALAVAYSNCFSFSHASIVGRGVGHPLSYPPQEKWKKF